MQQDKIVVAALISAAAISANAETRERVDTATVKQMQAVEVIAGRVGKGAPVAATDMKREDIERSNHGRDLPSLLEMMPGVTTTSDAGAGIGYTSLRIRGIDPSRINVTMNGIPMNEAESHQVFWVNTGDLASSLQGIQLQRGAGSSANGAGAFGASINMQSAASSTASYLSLDGTYGMWNTHKETFRMGTGLMDEHWTFDARLSNIGSDGYVDRASTHLQSFFTQTGFFAGQTSVKFLLFGGKEKTYHAWNYVSKEEMKLYGRRYNPCGEYRDDNGNVQYYANQDDVYQQLHSQLLVNHVFSSKWKLNAALHFTKGDGYYEEYKTGRNLKEYGLESLADADGNTVKKSDLVRRKQMDNRFMGEMANAEYSNKRLHLQFGEAANHYDGDHFGNVIWVKNRIGALRPDHEYYFNTGKKTDISVYAKGDIQLGAGWSAYADMQYRHVNYRIDGRNDNWDWINEHMQSLDINDRFGFFNPKVGINWQINGCNRLFASYSNVKKEPYRNCYTDGRMDDKGNIRDYPKPEKLHDIELGYQLALGTLSLEANIYYMYYRDQLVLTGELNDIGEALTSNVDKSYRLGIELQGAWQPASWFRWEANATWSRNRIKDFTEYLTDDVTYEVTANHLGDTRISMSPDWVAGNRLAFMHKGFEAALQTKYVSKQYMTNAEAEAHALDAYCVSNLCLSYTIRPRKGMKAIGIGVDINNLFNHEYETNGYAGAATYEGKRYDYAGYSVQAGTNVMGHISLNF